MFKFGILIAAIILLCDQVSKYWLLAIFELPSKGTIEILPFFNLVTVWNTGISFGMFSEMGAAYALIALASALTIFLCVWLYRTHHQFLALGIGLVIGGAIGNIIDRIRFGAVFDFIDIHAYGWHWPAFNIADSAICIGVVIILIDGSLCNNQTNSSS